MKFGIRKNKKNIFWLFVLGFLIGLILGLRTPVPTENAQIAINNTVAQ